MSNRHELREDNLCEKLGIPKDKKYLLRLVTFKKNESGKYVAFMTEEGWSDMGFAIPGWYPIRQEQGNNPFGLTRDRRDSFFGIINAQEILQPHEFDFDEIDGIEICNVQDDPLIEFMVKDNLLRLPIKPLFPPPPACVCNCGDLYEINWSIDTPNHTDEGAPSFMWWPVRDEVLGPGGHAWWAAPRSWGWTWSSGLQGGALGSYIDTWAYSSWIVPAIYSPQTSPDCDFKEPPIFTHPVCSHFEIAEWYFGMRTGYSISGTRTFLSGSLSLYYTIFKSGWNKLGKVGEACYTGNINAPKIGDNFIDTWNDPASNSGDAPEIPDDLPDGAPTPPGGFPSYDASATHSLTGPFSGVLQPCEECTCDDSAPPLYNPNCDSGGEL